MPVIPLTSSRRDCGTCGACCYRYRVVEVDDHDFATYATPVELTEPLPEGMRTMRRVPAQVPGRVLCADVCVAYDEVARRCTIYEHRPQSCRDFEVGRERCVHSAALYGEAWVRE